MVEHNNLWDLGVRIRRRLARLVCQVLGEHTSAYWIIVFQMGKVGSMSVVTSLKRVSGLTPIFHVHVLSERQTADMQHLIEQGIEVRRHRALVEYANTMRPKLVYRTKPRKKIISLVRDPVARLIATTMSEFDENNPGFFDRRTRFGPLDAPELHEFFAARQNYEYAFVSTWFDTEIRDLFGIDIFATPFPTQQGYQIYRGNSADLLLLRMEDLNHCYREAFGTFLGIPDFQLIGANRAEDKGPNYAYAYAEFKRTVVLPHHLLDTLYAIPWVKHLYTSQEIECFKARWQRNA